MAKWSIRLVACYFCLWAITDVYQLLKGTRQEKGFMVFDLGLTVNGKYVDAIAWIGVCILLHTGVQLLRFDSRGRSWALFILWFHSIASVLFFLAFLASLLPGDFVSYTIEPTIPAGLAFSIIFAFSLIPLYILLRKDIKMEFQRQGISEPKPAAE